MESNFLEEGEERGRGEGGGSVTSSPRGVYTHPPPPPSSVHQRGRGYTRHSGGTGSEGGSQDGLMGSLSVGGGTLEPPSDGPIDGGEEGEEQEGGVYVYV